MKTIILMYHSIVEDGKKGKDFYCLPLNKFKEQMGRVKEVTGSSVSQVTSIDQILSKDKAGQLRSREHIDIVITFDDGHISNYQYAYPLLKDFGFRAFFFIIVSRVGKNGYMSWQQLRELKTAGFQIGSHGMTHRIFTRLSDQEIEGEVKDSKKILEDNLNAAVQSLSIPRGFYNERIVQKAKESGYKKIFTSDLGIMNGNLDLFRLNRIPIKSSLSLNRFTRILKGKIMLKENLQDLFKKTAMSLVGVGNYEKMTKRWYKWT